MFNDDAYIWHKSQHTRWQTYCRTVQAVAAKTARKRKLRVAVLEIGAGEPWLGTRQDGALLTALHFSPGNNVTTVRATSEHLVSQFSSDANVAMIR